MNEAVENGSSLWPIITFGIYWAYVIAIYEQRRRKGVKSFFDLDLRTQETDSAHRRKPGRAAAFASSQINLDEDNFLAGAVKMYEFILANFAAGNTSEFVELLSPDVFEVFSDHIEARTRRVETLSLDILTLIDAQIIATHICNTTYEITIRFEADIFVSKQELNSSQPLVHSPQLLNAIDIWTFQKRADVTGRNWILVAVDAEDQDPAD